MPTNQIQKASFSRNRESPRPKRIVRGPVTHTHVPHPLLANNASRDPDKLPPIFLAPPITQTKKWATPKKSYLFTDPNTVSLYPFKIPPPPGGKRPMRYHWEFITTPTADTPGTTLILHFDDKRYIFGHMGEGTQRAINQRGGRLMSVNDVFVSGTTKWATTGGLLGMVLTLADATSVSAVAQSDMQREQLENLQRRLETETNPKQRKAMQEVLERKLAKNQATMEELEHKSSVSFHGGPNLSHFVATGRRFVFRTGMPLFVNEFSDLNGFVGPDGKGKPTAEPSWSDDHLNVWALPILPSGSSAGGKRTRKRSLDEFQEDEAMSDVSVETANAYQKRVQDQIVRQAVVSDMFNSDWRLDALVETPLAQVQMPAKVFVRNPETDEVEPYKGPKPGPDVAVSDLPDINVLVRQPWPGAATTTLPPTTPSEVSMSYIVQHHDIRGKFDPQKALALGVEKGPKFGKLTQEESVQSIDGKTITPDMVIGPSVPGGGIAIMDIPSAEYVENLLDRPEWTTPEVMKGFHAFVWVLGPGVAAHPRLQAFVSKMSQYEHVISSPDHCPNYLPYRNSAIMTSRFAVIDAERYRVPNHDNVTVPQKGLLPAGSPKQPPIEHNAAFKPAVAGLRIGMQPKFELSKTNVPEDVDTKQVQRDIRKTAGSHCARIHDTINKDKFQSKLKEFLRDLPNQDAEIVTLGTGSSLPSRYRNVSATLLKVPGHGNYLFDCGENTLGQLQRRYTPEELKEILRDLKVIWISHLHADHHLGTVAVIKAWHQEVYGAPPGAPAEPEQDLTKILSEKRLCIVSAKHMIQWLSEYACVENYGFDKIVPIESDTVFKAGQVDSIFTYNHFASDRTPLLDHDGNQIRTPLSFDPSASPLAPLLQSLTGLSSILVAPVLHCAGSQGTAFVFPSGFKVAYSGDCRPSGHFTGIGQDATVLIHECTFDDTMKSDAIAKRHSTISEALKVGAAMRARIIVLTHFSQRYGTGPRDSSFRLLWDPEYRSRKVSQAGTKSSRWRSRSPSPTPSQSPSRSNALDDRNANFNPDVPMPDIDFSDDIPISRLPSTTHHPSCVPVVTGYDLMSVRVGDALNAQEYGQAMMRVFCATLGEEEAATEQIDSQGGNAGETESARKKKKAEKKKEKEKEAAEQKALRVKKAVEKAQEKARRAAEESGKGVEWRVDKMTPAQRRGRREPGFVYESTAVGAERGDGSGEENAAASAAGGQ